jgi:hypothetical protein
MFPVHLKNGRDGDLTRKAATQTYPSKGEVKGEVYGTANSSQYNVDSPLEQVDFWGDGMERRGQ